MGDRVLVVFHDDHEVSPVVYLHWGGATVLDHIAKTYELMSDRLTDMGYAAARFVGVCAAAIGLDSSTGLGIWNAPSPSPNCAGADKDTPAGAKRETMNVLSQLQAEKYSHGDAGVLLVDITGGRWFVRGYHGYYDDHGSAKKKLVALNRRLRPSLKAVVP